jgi:hypothetical protein
MLADDAAFGTLSFERRFDISSGHQALRDEDVADQHEWGPFIAVRL